MNEILKDKKNLINILVLAVLILAVPIGIALIQRQQTLRSQAVQATTVTFSGPNVSVNNGTTILKLQDNGNGGLQGKANLVITAPNPPAQ